MQKQASDLGLRLSGTIEFAFRRRYNLPPDDPRFLDCSVADIIVDYWAHRHADDPALRNAVVTDDWDAEEAALDEVDRLLGEEMDRVAAADAAGYDTVIDDTYGRG